MTPPSETPIVPPVAEVVARYRGRVVDVRHIHWSEPPAFAPPALLAGGALVLLVGLGLALHAVAEAAACTAPPCPTTGADAGLGVLLVVLGLVPLVLGLVRWRDRARSRYTIGEAPDVDLTVALAGPARDRHPLVIALEQGLVLGLPPGARGRVDGPNPVDVASALAQGRRSLALPADARARIELGELSFEIHPVPPAARERPVFALDRLAWLSQVAAAALLGGWFVHLGRTDVQPPALDVPAELERVARYLAAPASPSTPPASAPAVAPLRSATRTPRPTPAEPVPEPPPAPAVAVDPDSGLVAPTSPTAFVRRHKHGTGRTDSEHDYDRVAGHLGDPGFSGAVDDFTVHMKQGQRGYAITPEVDAWWAQATGGPPRTSKHFGGLDLAETERGGGVHPDKPPAPKQPVSTVTLTAAARTLPPPTAEEEARIRRLTTIEMDPPSLDPDAGIDRTRLYQYARGKTAAWRTCYESGLDKNPALGGVTKLLVRFDARGEVAHASIAYTTLSIGAIDDCLVAAVKRWKLTPATPKPTTAVFHLQFSARTR